MKPIIAQELLDKNVDFQHKVNQMTTPEIDIYIDNIFAFIDTLPKKRYRTVEENLNFEKAQVALHILIAQGLLRIEKLINSVTI